MLSSSSDIRKNKRAPTTCAVCSAPALYYYVGAIVCPSCKVFFKRNVLLQSKTLKCPFDGDCEINENNRHICTLCRLNKCYAVGMQKDLLRGPALKRVSSRKSSTRNTPMYMETVNLLESDASTLNADQWNLLSNLTHCYDDQCKIQLAKSFLIQQSAIPLKVRFKKETVYDLVYSISIGTQQLFERNNDFRSLAKHDQSLLLERTLKHVACLVSTFTLGVADLYKDSGFFETMVGIYGQSCLSNATLASDFLDEDIAVVKLVLSIMIFSTLDCSLDAQTQFENLEDLSLVQRIQDRYIELAWKYILYRYGHIRAVNCFSSIIRCIFSMMRSLFAASDVTIFKKIIDAVTDQTKEKLEIS